jgi:hypothetical protein
LPEIFVQQFPFDDFEVEVELAYETVNFELIRWKCTCFLLTIGAHFMPSLLL